MGAGNDLSDNLIASSVASLGNKSGTNENGSPSANAGTKEDLNLLSWIIKKRSVILHNSKHASLLKNKFK